MHGGRKMPELDAYLRAVKGLREHHQAHRADDCDLCKLWLAYVRNDVKAIDEIIARNPREDWGEAGWTARDIRGEL